LGRLLETGRPDELYARPATRFVATFLGAANLLLGKQAGNGIRFGAVPVSARPTDRSDGAREQAFREHEVVAVLRPEEVELSPSRDLLSSPYIGQGTVEELVFTGALERMRVRMLAGDATPVVDKPGSVDASGAALLEV